MALKENRTMVISDMVEVIYKLCSLNNGKVMYQMNYLKEKAKDLGIVFMTSATVMGKCMEDASDILEEKYGITTSVIRSGTSSRTYISEVISNDNR